jgi:hypothetical protein
MRISLRLYYRPRQREKEKPWVYREERERTPTALASTREERELLKEFKE